METTLSSSQRSTRSITTQRPTGRSFWTACASSTWGAPTLRYGSRVRGGLPSLCLGVPFPEVPRAAPLAAALGVSGAGAILWGGELQGVLADTHDPGRAARLWPG
ncbi:hypothetical protein [Chlamydia psittaci]|uniref:hypothetical protein n=1 Tax=Chlamydia psittaci TaxID=83554 RepID=UPI002444096F|nr:hypothetical protein [Chlamydia psittaci]